MPLISFSFYFDIIFTTREILGNFSRINNPLFTIFQVIFKHHHSIEKIKIA